MNHATRYLASDLAARRILVNAVVPGLIATDWRRDWAQAAADQAGTTAEAFIDEVCRAQQGFCWGDGRNPRRWRTSSSSSASARAAYITGTTVMVDGGLTVNAQVNGPRAKRQLTLEPLLGMPRLSSLGPPQLPAQEFVAPDSWSGRSSLRVGPSTRGRGGPMGASVHGMHPPTRTRHAWRGVALTLSMVALLGTTTTPVAGAQRPEPTETRVARTLGHAPDRVIVGFEPGTSKARRGLAIARAEGSAVERVEPIARDAVLVHLAKGQSVGRAIDRISSRPEVSYAEPDFWIEPAENPNDPIYKRIPTGGCTEMLRRPATRTVRGPARPGRRVQSARPMCTWASSTRAFSSAMRTSPPTCGRTPGTR